MTTQQVLFSQLSIDLDNTLPMEEYSAKASRSLGKAECVGLAADIAKGDFLNKTRSFYVETFGDIWEKQFRGFLKGHDLTPAKAQKLIQLAENAIQAFGDEAEEVAAKMTRPAFQLAVGAVAEVQTLIKEEALSGEGLMRKGDVAAQINEWDVVTSEWLPVPVKERIDDGSLPIKEVAPLVKELGEMPEELAVSFTNEMAEASFIAENIKEAKKSAKDLNKFLKHSPNIVTLNEHKLDGVINESLKDPMYLDFVAKIAAKAEQVEKYSAKLYLAHKSLGELADRLYVETGANHPNLRLLIAALDNLTGPVIRYESEKMSYSFVVRDDSTKGFNTEDKQLVQQNQTLQNRVKELEAKLNECLNSSCGSVVTNQTVKTKEQIKWEQETQNFSNLPDPINDDEDIENDYDEVGDDYTESWTEDEYYLDNKGMDLNLLDEPSLDEDKEDALEGSLEEKQDVKQLEALKKKELVLPTTIYRMDGTILINNKPVLNASGQYEFVDFLANKVVVDPSQVDLVHQASINECINLLKLTKTPDDIRQLYSDYSESLNGTFDALKYHVYLDSDVVNHLYMVRLTSLLVRLEETFREEKLQIDAGKEIEQWAGRYYDRLVGENGSQTFGRAMSFLQQTQPAIYESLQAFIVAELAKSKVTAVSV